MIDNNRIPSNGKILFPPHLSRCPPHCLMIKSSLDFSDMMGFVSIDNRPEFFIDLLNSTYLNDTFMYNVTNISLNSIDVKEEKNSTLEYVLMSLITVILGLLILITIIGE